MNFQRAEDVIKWVHSLERLGMKPGLERIQWLMERLGHPERRLKFVHIAGTNGKGSTLAFLRHVLQRAGYRVGTFTSPYLIRFQNRIQIDGEDIADEHLVSAANRIRPLVDELAQTELGSPTEFEVLTALAIHFFAQTAHPDLVLWEAGLGGRLDSTNVVTPIVTVITNVGYDHVHLLGHSLEEIAFEKAGIIKPGVPLVTGVQNERAWPLIEARAKEKKASVYRMGQAFHIDKESSTAHGERFSYRSLFTRWSDLEIPLKGVHQVQNAAVAVMTLEVLKQFYAIIWEEGELRQGLAETRWPGRFEVIGEEPLVLIDAAHNPQGIEALAEALKRHHPHRKWTFIFSSLTDKPIGEMIKPLAGLPEEIILTQFEGGERMASAQLLAQRLQRDEKLQKEGVLDQLKISVESDWLAAYERAVAAARPDQAICFTGSIYFIAQVREKLIKDLNVRR